MKKIILLFSLMIILLSSCEKEVLYNDYVKLSVTSFTFDPQSSQSVEVDVVTNNSAEWSVVLEEGDWVNYSVEPGKIIITAENNEGAESRTAVLSVISGKAKSKINLNQLPFGFTGRLVDFPMASVGGVSRNGLYAGYVNQEYDINTDKFNYTCKVYNTETGEITEYEVPTITSWDGSMTNNKFSGISCISDDGKTIMFSHSGQARTLIKKDGVDYDDLSLPEGFINPNPEYFSSDASVIVGSCRMVSESMPVPVVWRNGTPEILEIPEFVANGDPMSINGVYARGCSDDGSVVYGSEWKLFGLIYWKNGEMFDIGAKYAEDLGDRKVALIQTHSSTTNISPNGKFIAAYFNANGSGALGAEYYPVVVDTETGEATIYREYHGYMGVHAMNDGTIFVAKQMATNGASVIDYKTGELKSVTDWAKERYGLMLSDNRFIDYISADEQVLYGTKLISGGTSVLTPGWFLRR